MKRDGKKWQEIAETIGTKNEQQCRTRGLVLWNKLRKHCWDKELFEVLKPTGKAGRRPEVDENGTIISRRNARRGGRKTLRLVDKPGDKEGGEGEGGTSFTKKIIEGSAKKA